jgi:uncharacterized circularly permuted ATP-grasp superfamily protein/uncharacterized alpha-E superfamily protein
LNDDQSNQNVNSGQQQRQLIQQQQQFQSSVGEMRSASPTGRFFDPYAAPPGLYDEIRDASGQLRPQWSGIDQALGSLSPEVFQRRLTQIRRFMHQNGIVFSSYGDPNDRKNHLQLDPIPQLIDAATWETISAGLQQRAQVYNLLLEDIYGPQKLLTGGVIPPNVIYNHPYFDPSFEDVKPAGDRHLHFYAAELVRSPAGKWWVVADRSDAPGGSGFALENRLAISRTFSNVFRDANAHRLAGYFIQMKDFLNSLGTTNRSAPHVVMLTAGTGSASYFEDAYLSQYLNITLVESPDLTVRKNRVMMKTLGGLIPIDVIYRRQHCVGFDPLEQGTTGPGIAGILQVARSGNVAISNPIGSGLVESPIFMTFLPRICQALLGTELKLPGVGAWWGGDESSLKLIRDRIDELELVAAYRTRTQYGSRIKADNNTDNLSRAEKLALLDKAPHLWCGKERILRSSSSVWTDGALTPEYLSLRTYLVANSHKTNRRAGDTDSDTSPDEYTVMPGGLSRLTDTPDEPIRRPFQGGGVKDCWVLSDEPVEAVSLLDSSRSGKDSHRNDHYISSRTADNFCWLGRYLERCDATARLVRAVLKRLTGESRPSEVRELPSLVRALAAEGGVDAGYAVPELRRQLPDLEKTITDCFVDDKEPNSLRSLVDQFYFVGTEVREMLSSDAWRIIQHVREGFLIERFSDCDLSEHTEITNEFLVDLAALSGFISESMTRTHGFRFLNIGRRIERALQIIRLVKNCFLYKTQINDELLEATLEVADSLMTYRARYQSNLDLENVLMLMLTDDDNPRSLVYQLISLNQSVQSLPILVKTKTLATHQRLSMEALHCARMVQMPELCKLDGAGRHHGLQDLCSSMESILPQLSVSISNQYFIHSGPILQMNELG